MHALDTQSACKHIQTQVLRNGQDIFIISIFNRSAADDFEKALLRQISASDRMQSEPYSSIEILSMNLDWPESEVYYDCNDSIPMSWPPSSVKKLPRTGSTLWTPLIADVARRERGRLDTGANMSPRHSSV